MPETKEDLLAERDLLRGELEAKTAEVENLRGQLAVAGASRPGVAAPVQHRFELSQGQLADLETYGVTNVGGRQLTTDQVRGMLTGDQADLQIKDASTPQMALPIREQQAAVPGVDFVYPSVAPGQLDPAVAGTPGISGPAAGTE